MRFRCFYSRKRILFFTFKLRRSLSRVKCVPELSPSRFFQPCQVVTPEVCSHAPQARASPLLLQAQRRGTNGRVKRIETKLAFVSTWQVQVRLAHQSPIASPQDWPGSLPASHPRSPQSICWSRCARHWRSMQRGTRQAQVHRYNQRWLIVRGIYGSSAYRHKRVIRAG